MFHVPLISALRAGNHPDIDQLLGIAELDAEISDSQAEDRARRELSISWPFPGADRRSTPRLDAEFDRAVPRK